MAYTHYWSVPITHPDYRAAWPRLVGDTARIIDAVRRHGIVIAGPHGFGRPILNPACDIAFNGDATSDLDGDTFVLPAPPPAAEPTPWLANFCKTSRKPYDAAVTAVLLRARLLLPEVFILSSDGTWNRQWRLGARLPGGRRRAPATRTLVTDLFGPIPQADPLTRVDPHAWRAGP
ncbi:hypothetical protein ACIBSW_39695 [Actinoplanes sp. NPDC049668]|uniref:hypothetical protein n=1 Tax=unclassified Actinoplanes TaxID=2626549 RepID=UPI0033BED861